MNKNQVLTKLMAECARSEMCRGQVREKLHRMLGENAENEAEEIINKLCTDNFICDARFAKSYVRDRYRFYGWGPRKIEEKLRSWGIEKTIIAEALDSEKSLERETLRKIVESKKKVIDTSADKKLAMLESELRKAIDSEEDDYHKKYDAIRKVKSKIYAVSQGRRAKLLAFVRQRGFDNIGSDLL